MVLPFGSRGLRIEALGNNSRGGVRVVPRRSTGGHTSGVARRRGAVVAEAGFQGSGCAISTASASLMTESLKGKTRAEAEGLFDRFHDLLTGNTVVPDLEKLALGKLAVFSGVRQYPVRVKCATLAW